MVGGGGGVDVEGEGVGRGGGDGDVGWGWELCTICTYMYYTGLYILNNM